ncbi:hypothetical protein EVAR_27170_1 [Eumeta japonica]|uniref:Uncharacterized protein n=1 Tax=Eumeta variegata TaxID=151549 RepID=A0A4C1VYV2_EUMVA|nr:hypothetical protein EVAR_27170_1 [Eumeta japonica]
MRRMGKKLKDHLNGPISMDKATSITHSPEVASDRLCGVVPRETSSIDSVPGAPRRRGSTRPEVTKIQRHNQTFHV